MYKLWTLEVKKTVLNYCKPGRLLLTCIWRCWWHCKPRRDLSWKDKKKNRNKAHVFSIVHELLAL